MPPKHDAGTATRHYRAFWQRRCRAAAAGAVLKPQGGNCAVLPKVSRIFYTKKGRLCVNRPVLCLGVSEKSKISSISTNTAGFYIKKPYILLVFAKYPSFSWAIPHNSKCRYGERGAAAAKPKAQIILDAAKVSAASGGNSEPKQGQRSQRARGFCPRSTMRVPQPDIIEHFGNADAVPQPPERCLSRQAGIVRCCPWFSDTP